MAGAQLGCLDSEAVNYETRALTHARIDLFSPDTCEVINGSLRHCEIPTVTIEAEPVDTAEPLRTTVRRFRTGDCSTHYLTSVTIEAPADPPREYFYTVDPELRFRARGGAFVPRVTIRDGSSWTEYVRLDESCRIWLEIWLNEDDPFVPTPDAGPPPTSDADVPPTDAGMPPSPDSSDAGMPSFPGAVPAGTEFLITD